MDLPDSPFTFADRASVGLTDHQLRALAEAGVIRRVLRGVYADAALPDDTYLRAAAAKLALPRHVVISDRSASWLYEIDAFDPVETDYPPVLEVVSLPGHEPTRRVDVLGGKRALLPDEVTEMDGVALTTPLRTACDLGCRRGRYGAYAALNAFARAFGLSRADLRGMAARYGGRRGVRQLRELIELVDPELESPGESWTFLAIVDAGLPAPRAQVWTWLPGIGRVRLDLVYRGSRVVVEYDGEDFHSTKEQRDADRARRRALREAGWHVIVVRKEQLSGRSLDAWLSELRGVLADRRPPVKRLHARGVRLGG